MQAQPVDVQAFDSSASQAPQLAPGAPQVLRVRSVQTSPAQQPLGHEAAVHLQLPLVQAWPAPQRAPVPHAQLPALEQPSARRGSHEKQVDPRVPHAAAVAGWVQTFPVQQPEVHDVASHSHCPLMQRSPLPHAAPAPHLHAPSLPQLLAWVVSQAAQVAPAAAHEVSERVVQPMPEQQPLGQVVASQPPSPLLLPPPPPPIPPSELLPPPVPPSPGQLARQKPLQQTVLPRQSPVSMHAVMPSDVGSEQLQAGRTAAPSNNINREIFRIVTPRGRNRAQSPAARRRRRR